MIRCVRCTTQSLASRGVPILKFVRFFFFLWTGCLEVASVVGWAATLLPTLMESADIYGQMGQVMVAGDNSNEDTEGGPQRDPVETSSSTLHSHTAPPAPTLPPRGPMDASSHIGQALALIESNEDTVRASNNRSSRPNQGLSNLFDPPAPTLPSHDPPPAPPMSLPPRAPHQVFGKQSSPRPIAPRPIRRDDRMVSWGDSSPATPDDVPREVGESQRQTHHARAISNIPFELLNPYETEAESNILRAIQSQSPAVVSRKSSILSQVPDERCHDFSLDEDASESDHGTVGATSLDEALAEITSALVAANEKVSSGDNDILIEQRDKESHNVENVPNEEENEAIPLIAHRRQPTTVEFALNDLTECLSTFRDLENQGKTSGGLEDQASVGHREEPTSDASNIESEESERSRTSERTAGGINHVPRPVLQGEEPLSRRSRRKSRKCRIRDLVTSGWETWSSFVQMNRGRFALYVKFVFLYVTFPGTFIACVLYYLAGNPLTSQGASVSWWLIFSCVRLVVTFTLALFTQSILIDFFALHTEVLLRTAGSVITLLLVHAKGWPFITFCWGIYNFGLLYGTQFAAHWMYYQNRIGVFSESNPDGGVLSHSANRTVLLIATVVSFAVALKRFLVGLFLGRQTYLHHGEQLAGLLGKMLFVSQIAAVAKAKERRLVPNDNISMRFTFEDGDSDTKCSNTVGTADRVIDTNARDPLTGSLNHHEKMKLYQLLEQWEDPQGNDYKAVDTASISAILKFRKALAFIQKRYPFSFAFGPARTREECIDSAQSIFDLLLKRSSQTNALQFETLVVIAVEDDGRVDQTKAKALMKAFRPDRQGNLSVLDFVRSIDAIYKEYKFLNASIENSSVIDRQLESIFNWVFYACIVIAVISQLGVDPLPLFLSLSSAILGFSFMIGSSASGFVDGLLFVVGRRPMGIGDGVCFGESLLHLDPSTSPPYFIKSITLLETTAVFAATNEVCSFSNASLANCRVVNLARSTNPVFNIRLQLPTDTTYDRILILKSAVEEFIKARPREWLCLKGFLAEQFEASQGWIQYTVLAQARGSWQDRGRALDSKANLSSYCQEVMKQLKINYVAPALPVDLRYRKPEDTDRKLDDTDAESSLDTEARAQQFRLMATNANFNIRYN